jgi:purine-binding chemotaxis protein CheW
MATSVEAVPGGQYLSFFIAGEEFAVDILRVREIIEYGVLTVVPGMPDCVRGVINLRGRVVPVIDLGVRFGLPTGAVTRRSCIVVVETTRDDESIVMGIVADAVHQVLALEPSTIEPPPAFGSRIEAEFLVGMAQSGPKFVMLLDSDRALAVESLLRPATATGTAPAEGGDAPAIADAIATESPMP